MRMKGISTSSKITRFPRMMCWKLSERLVKLLIFRCLQLGNILLSLAQVPSEAISSCLLPLHWKPFVRRSILMGMIWPNSKLEWVCAFYRQTLVKYLRKSWRIRVPFLILLLSQPATRIRSKRILQKMRSSLRVALTSWLMPTRSLMLVDALLELKVAIWSVLLNFVPRASMQKDLQANKVVAWTIWSSYVSEVKEAASKNQWQVKKVKRT